jgi:hypothetical protein
MIQARIPLGRASSVTPHKNVSARGVAGYGFSPTRGNDARAAVLLVAWSVGPAGPLPRGFDAKLCEHAGCEPAGVALARHGKLDDLLPDQLCHAISQADGALKLGAHRFKRLVHDADLLGLESESTGSGSFHRGAADCWAAPDRPSAYTWWPADV